MSDKPDFEPYPYIPLYATEEQIARVVFGKGPTNRKHWKGLADRLANYGMPQPDPVTKRRYWPAVRAFLDRYNGIGSIKVTGPTWEENFSDPPRRARRSPPKPG